MGFLDFYWEGRILVKKATIVIVLVDESKEKSNEELEREIFDVLSRYPSRVPWMRQVLKVEVTEG